MSDKQRNYILLVLILLASALVRFYGIGRQSYWIDELVSVHFAKSPISTSVLWDNVPFFYHLILKGWIKLVGDGEFFTRLLSLLFSVGTTGVLWKLGTVLGGVSGGLIIGGLHIFMPLSITYAQETRMYAMFEFFSALSSYSFYQFYKNKKNGFLYAISTSLMCITHYLAVIPLVIQSMWVLSVFKKEQKTWRWGVIGIGLGGVSILISYWVFFSWPHLDWQRLKFEMEPVTRWPGEVLWSLLHGSWFSIIGYIILLFSFLTTYNTKENRDAWFFFSFIILPILIFQSIVFSLKRSVFLPRYFIYIVPFLLPWIYLNVRYLAQRKKTLAVLVGVLIVIGTISGLSKVYLQTKAPWREVAQFIGQYTNSVVLTTRTNAIRTPYFERINADVEKWQPNEEGLRRILQHLDQGKSVWLIENYWGGLTYLNQLKANLEEMGIHSEEKIHKIENSEPLLTLRFYR